MGLGSPGSMWAAQAQELSSPLSQWCILHIPPMSTNFLIRPLFSQNLYISPPSISATRRFTQ